MNQDIATDLNQKKLLKRLQSLDFAVIEVGMYLDGHPNHRKALAYYDKVNAERKKVTEQYEKAFGPLTIYQNDNPNEWEWIKNPWPWEMEE